MAENLGPYQILGELGRGAMAVVWRGFDTRLEREVAIKEPIVAPGTDAATAAELAARFVREGQAAAKLNHPGIVTIHAADIYEGRPAIVMELIEGETLGQLLSRGPLTPPSALAVLDQLLDAVAYAHARGVVHRDIKPDNVFVTSDGRVKLTDFGIAHVGSGTALTQAGTMMGTPGYMAPEQVTGAPVDARADIFAIGVVAYELLTGHNPFGATDGTALTTVMYRIVHEPVRLQAIDRLAPSIKGAIVVALHKGAEERFATAEQMRSALKTPFPLAGKRLSHGAGSQAVFADSDPPQGFPERASDALSSTGALMGRTWVIASLVVTGVLVLVGLLWSASDSSGPISGGGALDGGFDATSDIPVVRDSLEASPEAAAEPGAASAEDALRGYLDACQTGDVEAAWNLRLPEYRDSHSRSDMVVLRQVETYPGIVEERGEFYDVAYVTDGPMEPEFLDHYDYFEVLAHTEERYSVEFQKSIGHHWTWLGTVTAIRNDEGWWIESALMGTGSGE